MGSNHTEQQSREDQRRSLQLSLQRTHPPTEVPGYELKKFLGSGAYGEVWVGIDTNTCRRVAVKFYTHRGGLDWSLLSREVEKLVFLSADRYVVQLLDVGWSAEPPYYVMEYIENGSLDDRIREHGTLALGEAVDLLREVAIGLVHAHGKGVLHCDLKPANILLDEDNKPRLADFGQSRLSHEQSPSLGTLFYMAPEQADLDAVPDARWDVYALGAMLYCALIGEPPYRSEQAMAELDEAMDLADRLARYRHIIHSSPPPTKHRRVPGMDRSLAEIIDTCLACDPARRYANVQGVVDALGARDRLRARRPLMVLGFVGPMLLLMIMALFGWRGYNQAKRDSVFEITKRARETNYFAAQAVSGKAAEDIERYFRAVEAVADTPQFQQLLDETVNQDELQALLQQLNDPQLNATPLEARVRLREHPERQPLQQHVQSLIQHPDKPRAASWFVCDPDGTQLAAVFEDEGATSTIGQNFAWRTYYHGGQDDLISEETIDGTRQVHYRRPLTGQRIGETHLSAPFQSKATNRWKVAISGPVHREGRFLGIVALTVDIGVFMRFEEGSASFFAVLVDGRPGKQAGMILQHPLFDRTVARQGKLPERFSQYRIDAATFQENGKKRYQDPLGSDPEGSDYARSWIAAHAHVKLERGRADSQGKRKTVDTGLIVLVQEDHGAAIEPVNKLGSRLVREGLLALLGVIVVVIGLWCVVLRVLRVPAATPTVRSQAVATATPLHSLTTVAVPQPHQMPPDHGTTE